MADEFVRKDHFDEYVLRIDERFLSLEKRTEQGFAHAEKAREQNLVHVNQRFDGLERGLSELRSDMRQMRNWLVGLFGLVVFGFVGSGALILFRGLVLK